MSMIKMAMASAAALGVVMAGTAASAEPVRAAAATPGVVSVKKIKTSRTTAPSARESRELSGTDIGLGLLVAGAVGVGVYEATKSTDSNGG
ncbi:hypothetical protein NSE01_14830 [Novosphingobium sediminis]|uniref:Secreted protein n=1 Tax=Novosphingobium sediminis TaxID=707214 RepID=A0A512AIX7_9SPHN|nr:hypothetical protein [Novosphingobium sediminis]GEN99650.1 hypothetical protein NSE01_14830 [Novosphingobium sediminis]